MLILPMEVVGSTANEGDIVNSVDESSTSNISDNIHNPFQHDIFDQELGMQLVPNDRYLGAKRNLFIEHGPRNKLSRRFFTYHTLDFYLMDKSVTHDGLYTKKILTK